MRRSARLLAPVSLLAFAVGAAAQTIATSARPDSVDVTVYRDPGRPADREPMLRWLNGYALISERRQVTIPAGESDIRFEGVAGGIIPQSAIVTGLPEGIVERNRDAYLLSPATLLDRSLGRRVHLRRTSRATGEVREHEAIVRSGAGGAVVLETEQGIEALRCTGLAESVVYDQVPPDLSARPTLSVRARSSQPVTATVELSYLATGFDWQANYVATLSPDETRLDLFAWLTLANGDETSFVEADTQAVAGRINWSYARVPHAEGGPLTLQCWPQGTTSDLDLEEAEEIMVTGSRVADVVPPPSPLPPPPPPPPPPAPAMEAVQEDLGDLKLYRIPEPVTVAANSQKQIALLQREGVRVNVVYRTTVYPTESVQAGPAYRVLVTRNRTAEGLGLPLPAGRLRLFSSGTPRPILLGQGTVEDRAIGEDVEIGVGPATGVRYELRLLTRQESRRSYELTVTNDRSRPITFEGDMWGADLVVHSRATLTRRDGRPWWVVRIPANGTVTLRYDVTY